MPLVDVESALVVTPTGLKDLVEVLSRPFEPILWCREWLCKGQKVGISFHCDYRHAKNYVAVDCDARRAARLVTVSEWLYNVVCNKGDYWATFTEVEEARYFRGPSVH